MIRRIFIILIFCGFYGVVNFKPVPVMLSTLLLALFLFAISETA